MVNEEKLRIMTRIAWCEQEECKEELKSSKYYKHDYIRLNVLKSILSMTIGYILILAMAVVYHIEYLVMNAVKLDYREILYTAVGVYLLLLLAYTVGSYLLYHARYKQNIKKLRAYYAYLKRLQKFYNEEI